MINLLFPFTVGGPGIRVANKTATPSGTKRQHEGSEPQSRPEVKRFTPSHENKQDKSQVLTSQITFSFVENQEH